MICVTETYLSYQKLVYLTWVIVKSQLTTRHKINE